MKPVPSPSPALCALYYVLISVSAVFILLPAARSMPFAKLVVGVMVMVYGAIMVKDLMKSGRGKMTLREIHAEAKTGQKLSHPLDTAASIAVMIAFFTTI